LNTTTGRPLIAAAGAVVPPAVLLVATHGVALLVRARTAGCAWAMTVALAGCAFGLSFDALRGLVPVAERDQARCLARLAGRLPCFDPSIGEADV
jgi:hypothetical protein